MQSRPEGAVTLLTTSPGFGKAGDLPDRMEAAGWTLLRCTEADLWSHLPTVDFLIAGLPAVTAAMLDAAPRLRAVMKHGVGLDAIDVAACTARGIPVTSTPGANALAVAELALAQVFALSRQVVQSNAAIVADRWERQVGHEVEGATLGIVGFGRIGQILAAKAQALGMRVLAHDPFASPAQAAVPLVPLSQLLAQADHVSLHVPGGASTINLIGAAELALMKPTACLLNFARGDVLDLPALDAALTQGRLRGAAIDAYRVEPPDRSEPIFANPKVIFTPHSGADTMGSFLRMGQMILDDIATLLAGGRPARTANPSAYGVSR